MPLPTRPARPTPRTGNGTVTDSLSHATSMTYGHRWQLHACHRRQLQHGQRDFDGLGHRLTVTDPLSHTTTGRWTPGAGRRVSRRLGHDSLAYDAEDQSPARPTQTPHDLPTYDDDGRPLVTTKANGDAFTNTYDTTGKLGLLASTTDGNSHTTTYSYTTRNQKSSSAIPTAPRRVD